MRDRPTDRTFTSECATRRAHAPSWRVGLVLASVTGVVAPAFAETERLEVEKDELTLGFIKLTDMAPLAVAYENGYSATRLESARSVIDVEPAAITTER